MIFFFFRILVIFIVGIVASYSDYFKGKIWNNLVFSGMIAAFIFELIDPLYPSFLDFFINFIFAFIIGYIIWKAELWCAGDAKLFIAFASLIPFSVLLNGIPINFFPTFVVLSNTFVPLFVYFFLKVIFTTTMQEKKKALSKVLKPDRLFSFFLNIIIFSKLTQIFFTYFGLRQEFFSSLVLIIILFEVQRMLGLKKLFLLKTNFLYVNKKELKSFLERHAGTVFMILLTILLILLNFQEFFSLLYIINLISILFSYLFFRSFILELSVFSFGELLKISLLREGMVLLEGVKKRGKKYVKATVMFHSFHNLILPRFDEYFLAPNLRGLRKEEIKGLKRLDKKGLLDFKEIMVQRTLPFAHALLIGVIVTILIQGNIFHFLGKILYSFL